MRRKAGCPHGGSWISEGQEQTEFMRKESVVEWESAFLVMCEMLERSFKFVGE